MPRELRIEYPGAICPVLNRADQREDIFLDEEDRQRFLGTLEESCGRTDWQVQAYGLMRNHFHLVIETPRANLVAGMHWLSGVYTKRFNIRHKLCGHVLAGRYKALLVAGRGNGYLRTVCDYVHLNPVRAKLLRPEEPLPSFAWSSYGEYLKPGVERPVWLRVDRLLGEKGIPRDSEAGREMVAWQMERRRAEEATADYRAIRRGWYLGSEQFRQELLAAERVGLSHYGAERQESDAQKAERIVRVEIGRLGWVEVDLAAQRKGDPRKVAIARRLRRETTMSLKWIAGRLQMGSWTYVSNLLHGAPAAAPQAQQQLALCQ
jgi:REP-associated tyrosine transposase